MQRAASQRLVRIAASLTLLLLLMLAGSEFLKGLGTPDQVDFKVYLTAAQLVREHKGVAIYSDADTGQNPQMRFAAPDSTFQQTAASIGIPQVRLHVYPPILLCLARLYQEKIHSCIPATGILLVAIMAFFGVVLTHNTFAFYRARVTLANNMQAAGIPATSTDNGWAYNFGVEVQHAPPSTTPTSPSLPTSTPPTPRPPLDQCHPFWHDYTPHIHALYGVSFDPHACDGRAPFAPVHYSRWLAHNPGTLYVVRYTPTAKP
jgi:hypothetical protein